MRSFGFRSPGSCGSASSRKGPTFLCAASGGVPGVLFCSSVFRGGRVCAPGRCSAAVRTDCGMNSLRKGGLSAAVFCSAPHGRSQRRPTQLFRFVGGYAVSRCCRGGSEYLQPTPTQLFRAGVRPLCVTQADCLCDVWVHMNIWTLGPMCAWDRIPIGRLRRKHVGRTEIPRAARGARSVIGPQCVRTRRTARNV